VWTFFGWVTLALGCTLGAPFWFDLIKQLAKLRAPASQPGSTPGSTAAQSASDEVSTLTRSSTETAEPPNAVMSDALNDAELAMTEAEIERVQRALGLTDAELSRRFDARTREAIRDWQSRRAYAATGELSAAQIAELLQAGAAGDDDYIG
jgi:peptidoglycan hydrolase-like protein with peptidoglycan-binding domain